MPFCRKHKLILPSLGFVCIPEFEIAFSNLLRDLEIPGVDDIMVMTALYGDDIWIEKRKDELDDKTYQAFCKFVHAVREIQRQLKNYS